MHLLQSDRIRAEGLLIAGVVAQYVATRVALGAIGRADGSAPGRWALGQWLPIASTALAAVAMGQTTMAVCLAFGSSVACLSLVLGMTTYVAPVQQLSPARRLWPLVLPAAILVLLAGFRGSLTWYHGAILLALGAAFLPLWLERSAEAPALNPAPHRGRIASLVIVALALSGAGAWAAVTGALRTSEHARLLTADLLATTVLSPMLMLPALGAGTMLAQRGHTGQVITALCGTTLLNLCLLLPLIIFINYMIAGLSHLNGYSVRAAFSEYARPTPYPLVTWRVDAVVLVLISLALLPLAAGRWLPERLEAMLLVIIYAGYIVAETALSAGLLG